MKFFGSDNEYIKGECEYCGRVLKIKHSGTIKTSTGYNLTPNIRCFCDKVHTTINGHAQSAAKQKDCDEVRCPKCNSLSLSANKQGFSLGKSLLGGVLAGPIGLLGGFWNAGKVKVTCLKCGYSWSVGK